MFILWVLTLCHLVLVSSQTDPSVYRDLVPGLTNILSQVLSHHLTVDYEYHSVPAPWLVILLLKLLARLGAGDLK